MDRFIYNNKTLRDRRRELRNNQTPAEKILWQYLSKNKIEGLRFHRQYGVGPYILDFYCTKLRLAIELDGGAHASEEGKLYDLDRESFLKAVNIQTLRFWNNDILNNIDKVIKEINKKIITLGKTKRPPLE